MRRTSSVSMPLESCPSRSGELSDVPSVDYWFRESESSSPISFSGQYHSRPSTIRTSLVRWSGCRPRTSDAPALLEAQSQISVFIRQINPVTYQLQLPSHYRTPSSFHVSLLKPYHSPVSVPTEPGLYDQ